MSKSKQKFWTVTLTPVRTEFNADKFSLTALQGMVTVDSDIIEDSPLALDKDMDLLGISQTKESLDAGLIDTTDSIEKYPYIGSLFLSTSMGIVELKTNTLNVIPLDKTFSARNATCAMEATSFLAIVPVKSILKRGMALQVKDYDFDKVAIRLVTSLKIGVETGECSASVTFCGVTGIYDGYSDGSQYELTENQKKILEEKICFVGFTLKANRINYNRPIRDKQ